MNQMVDPFIVLHVGLPIQNDEPTSEEDISLSDSIFNMSLHSDDLDASFDDNNDTLMYSSGERL